MMLTREIILAKLTDYLDHRLSKQAVYEWALSVAVSHEFEEASLKDALIGRTVQALIDIGHDDLKAIPTYKALDYYHRCLSGELTFEPLETKRDLDTLDLSKQIFRFERGATAEEKRKEQRKLFPIFRLYAVLFGLFSFAIHAFSIVNPEFLRFGEAIPTRSDNLSDSIPNLLYSLFIILPFSITTRGVLFWPSLFILLVGMLYYVYLPFSLIIKLSVHPIFVLALMPFTSIPALLAFFLLLDARGVWKKP